MKKLIVLILILAAGYFVYQKFVVGSLGDEQKQVQALADDFAAVKQQMAQAETSAGATGMDMTSDVDTAMGGAEAVLKKLRELKENLKEEKAREMANKLEVELQAFLNRK